jgi:hypothetical protein
MTAQTITLTGVHDLDVLNDLVNVTLSGGTGITDVVVPVTISDDDQQSIVANPAGPLTIMEGNMATVAVTLAARSASAR